MLGVECQKVLKLKRSKLLTFSFSIVVQALCSAWSVNNKNSKEYIINPKKKRGPQNTVVKCSSYAARGGVNVWVCG